jgi:hypothetical protein
MRTGCVSACRTGEFVQFSAAPQTCKPFLIARDRLNRYNSTDDQAARHLVVFAHRASYTSLAPTRMTGP